MSASVPVTVGGWQPSQGFGFDRPYQDGIFIRSQFMDDMRIESRENDLVILSTFGKKLGAGKARPGERFMVPTQSNVAVGDLNDTVTTGPYTFPDYIATDSPAITTISSFSRKIGAGSSFLGIPLPLQNVNEGQVELIINQYRGSAMVFTKRFIDTALGYIKNPGSAYSKKISYAIKNDMEEYAQLCWLYTGPITNTAGDYGTGLNSFTDAIGITNRTNYALTRTLTAINGSTNLITPTTSGSPAAGFSNTANARFSTYSVPFLFGNSAADVSFDTLARLKETFNQRNVPLNKRAIVCDPKTYSDIEYLPQFSKITMNPDSKVFKEGSLNGASSLGAEQGRILGFDVKMTNVIQPMGASSNVLYSLAGGDDCFLWDDPYPPDVIIDDKLSKPELAIIVMCATRYGCVVQRPDHTAVIQTRTRV